jgi:hypothetical protein
LRLKIRKPLRKNLGGLLSCGKFATETPKARRAFVIEFDYEL